MYIKDNEQEYQEGWREKIIDTFERNNSDTITCVWDIIPYHLSDEFLLETVKEVQEKYNCKATKWTICANVIYLTFERNGWNHSMEALQKACYPESG